MSLSPDPRRQQAGSNSCPIRSTTSMEPQFQVIGPSNTVLIVPGIPGDESKSGCFMLFVGANINRYETPPFEVQGLGISLRLKIMRDMNSTKKEMTIQFLLSDPEEDIIEVTVNGHKAILTPGLDSFLYQNESSSSLTVSEKSGINNNPGKYILSLPQHMAPSGGLFGSPVSYATAVRSDVSYAQLEIPPPKILSPTAYRFKLTQMAGKHKIMAAEELQTIAETLVFDAKLRIGEKEILTTRGLLARHSDVFKAMFEHETEEKQTGVVKITDFSFDVVQEMVHFMRHGYCGLWYKEWDKLSAIADKYDVIAMKELAAEKKKLLDQIS